MGASLLALAKSIYYPTVSILSKGRLADNGGTLQTNSLIEGLRGQLCCGFAGSLQLSTKVLPLKQHTQYTEQ